MANDRLRAAIHNAGMQVEDLAELLGVDSRTVHRWVAGRTPYSRHRTRTAKALHVHEHELWPELETDGRHPPTATGGLEMVGAFARTDDPLAPDPIRLLEQASERIDLLDFTLPVLRQPGIRGLLGTRAEAGVQVRLLVSYLTRARLATDTPIDEPYPDDPPAAAREIAIARGHIQQLAQTPGVQARRFAAMRFNTITRVDDQMLVTLHLWGSSTQQAPLLHLRADDHPTLFDAYQSHFNRIWQDASHPISSQPDAFPDPDRHAGHYKDPHFNDDPPTHHAG